MLIAAVSLLLLSAHLRFSRESIEVFEKVRSELLRAHSADIRWIFGGGAVVLRSSSPVRVLAVLSVSRENVRILSGEFVVDGEFSVDVWNESKILVLLEGGRYLLVDLENDLSDERLNTALYEAQISSKLLPLLARYLDPEDYLAVVESGIPLNISQYQLNPHYRPAVTWRTGSLTRYCYDNLLYVSLSWNSTHWVATYRMCASDGPVLDVLPVGRSASEVPYREYLYYRECMSGGGVKYCFNAYATARGKCVFWCDDPPNSRWFFEVGMRVEYRLEPLERSRNVLVVINRTLFENALMKTCVTCVRYLSSAGLWCWRCSNNQYAEVCDPKALISYAQGPRPAFVWDIMYSENHETHYNYDDGYAMGAWHPRVEVKPSPSSWRIFDRYAYAMGNSVVVTLYLSSADSEDFLARAGTHQYGYYRVSFDLVLDEGGAGRDSRAWDYRVLVFLLKTPSS